MATIPLSVFRRALILVMVSVSACFGASLTPEEREFFEKKIRPVLVEHCYECHSEQSKDVGGNLLLDTHEGLLKGGQSGPALAVGKPSESLLIQALRYEHVEMPPEQPLPEAVINDFVKWVENGAADPRQAAVAQTPPEPLDPEELWSFFPRKTPEVPPVKNERWPRDPIDNFVLSKIEASELSPTSDAAAHVLVRRIHIDLIGLPPTFEESQRFIREFEQEGQQAVERLVDELLSRPQFGERWGRHWLDVARYGESNGDDGLSRNASFPHAWRYRDYVIDAFNQDVPYDRFITEQIAGDLLPADSAEQRNRQLIATGFLAIGPKPAAAMNQDFAMDIVDDQINAVSTALMGLSVACARCHDHKHDPIPTRDYYALAGIFSSTESLYGAAGNEKLTAPPTELHSLVSAWEKEQPQQLTRKNLKFPEEYTATVKQLQPEIHARFDEAPEDLQFGSDVEFSAETYATVKTAMFKGEVAESTESYSIAFWFKNNTENAARPITAYLFSRGELGNTAIPGDHLGIGGNYQSDRTGKLFVFNGNGQKKSVAGNTTIKKGTWNHVVMIRNQQRVKVYLNGGSEPEIEAELPATFGDSREFCIANRSENFSPLVGQLADFSLYSRALSDEEAVALHDASGQPKGVSAIGVAMGVREKEKPTDCKIHVNGSGSKLGPSVPRGVLTAYERTCSEDSKASYSSRIAIDAEQSGRLELAKWLVNPDHPQTARVMVNRIWLHLFGRGIVSTPDDFGVYGARPTHPELLDHLANRFIDEGWSVKTLIRSIVLSRTYQLDSWAEESLLTTDSDNKLFARHDRRRLDAESLRDSMLQATGELLLEPGEGSPIEDLDVLINKPEGGVSSFHPPSRHRSVYLCMLRQAPPPELAAFDLPTGMRIVGQRNVSTLPSQTLYLLNNPFVIEQSAKLGELLLKEPDQSDEERVRDLFKRVLKRFPTESEMEGATQYVYAISQTLTDTTEIRLQKAWASLCQALLTTNEFRYID